MKTRQHILAAIALAFAAASPVWAVNKCKDASGKVTYQEHPCEAASNSQSLNINAGRMSVDDELAAQERLAKIKRDNANFDSMINGRIRIGMTSSQVQNAWGYPSKVNKSIGSYGTHEQWIYRNNGHNTQYVYIENGVVTSMQSP
ncbi:MAG: DUF4124 domain-containing protein [Comamonas sp.]